MQQRTKRTKKDKKGQKRTKKDKKGQNVIIQNNTKKGQKGQKRTKKDKMSFCNISFLSFFVLLGRFVLDVLSFFCPFSSFLSFFVL